MDDCITFPILGDSFAERYCAFLASSLNLAYDKADFVAMMLLCCLPDIVDFASLHCIQLFRAEPSRILGIEGVDPEILGSMLSRVEVVLENFKPSTAKDRLELDSTLIEAIDVSHINCLTMLLILLFKNSRQSKW